MKEMVTPTSSVMRERSRSRDPSPGLQLCSEHSDCGGAGGRGDQARCTGQWISPSPEEPGGTFDLCLNYTKLHEGSLSWARNLS